MNDRLEDGTLRDICPNCLRPIAVDEDFKRIEDGDGVYSKSDPEGAELCWYEQGGDCWPPDWYEDFLDSATPHGIKQILDAVIGFIPMAEQCFRAGLSMGEDGKTHSASFLWESSAQGQFVENCYRRYADMAERMLGEDDDDNTDDGPIVA